MDLLTWIPALTSTGLLAFAIWLGRNVISTRLTRSVEFEFNRKLEAVRAQLRESEARLNADLRLKETEIASLRGGALTAQASRAISLDKRRLEAVDQVWESVTALAPARGIALMMSFVKFESAARIAERDPKARHVFEKMSPDFDMKNLDVSGASKARPFVSPMVWAVYRAIVAVTMHGVTRWQVLKSGLAAEGLIDDEGVAKLIKTALPHYTDYIDKHGTSVYYSALDALDLRLLAELQKMLAGVEADAANIEQAAEIVRQSDEVLKQTQSE